MTNLEQAIAVMERVQENEVLLNRRLFDHRGFQGFLGFPLWELPKNTPIKKTERAILNHCGTTCCFAGWMVAAPEFQGINLEFKRDGSLRTKVRLPEIEDEHYPNSVAYVISQELGIPLKEADGLIYNTNLYYGKYSQEVTPQDVIDKLSQFL